MLNLRGILRYLIARGPDRTAVELARAIYGVGGYQQRVNQKLVTMIDDGEIERSGAGVNGDPFRYRLPG